MPLYIPLYGGCTGSDFCARCWAVCGRAPRKKKVAARTVKEKPPHLQYVRYHPTLNVNSAWRGADRRVPVLRVSPGLRLAGDAAVYPDAALVNPATQPVSGRIIAVPVRRKRKASG